MPEGLRIALLGAPSVSSGGAPLRGFVSAKVQALLFYLFVTRRPHSRSALAALLWGDMPESDARANLRVALVNLRQIAGAHFSIGRDQIALAADAHYWLDVDVFQSRLRLLDAPAAGQDDQALQTALGLYRGDFLEGFSLRDAPDFEEWALLQREQMRQIALQALHTLAASAAERGAYSAGIGFANRLLALDPWREETHRQLMLLLALSGQREAALAQYEACRRVLRAELGVAPLEATTALYERIRAGHLHRPAAAPTAPTTPAGRADAQAWLVQQWEQARSGAVGLTLIEGPAGAGKTFLAEAVLGFVADDGARVLSGRCLRPDAGLPLLPLATALRAGLVAEPQAARRLAPAWRAELARLLPELADQDSLALPGPQDDTARLRLFEAIARLLIALSGAEQGQPRPLILWLDELHRADPATLDLLRFLAERLAAAPLWLLAAARPAWAGWPAGLAALCHALAQEGRLALLRLGPLDEAGMEQVLDELPLSAQDDRAALVSFLGRWTGGNPALLRALLADLQGRGLLVGGERGWRVRDRAALAAWEAAPRLPDRARELLLVPVTSLGPGARALLERLAVLGRPCTAALLERLGADLPDRAAALAECLERRLLTSALPDSYDLAGPLLRLALVQGLAPEQRRRLHASVGAALEQLCGPECPHAQEAARHYGAAGDRLRAFAAARRAAEHTCRGLPWGALRLLIDEALAMEQQAGCVPHPALLPLRAACSAALGDAVSWGTDLEALEQQAGPAGGQHAGRLLARADQALCAGAPARCVALAQQGTEEALLAGMPGLAAACLRLGALALLEQGDADAAGRWGCQADELDSGEEQRWAALPGQRWPELRGLYRLPALDRLLDGRAAAALTRLEERARQTAGTGDPAAADAPLAAGHIHAALLDADAALAAYKAALEQARAAGRPELSAYLLLCCGRALLAGGRPAEAQGYFRASLVLQGRDRQEILREEALCGLSACALALGQPAEAQALLAGLRGTSADLLLAQIEAAAATGQTREALRLADQLVALGELLDDQDDITPETWWRAGQALACCGDLSGAGRLFAQGDRLLHAHAARLHSADLRLVLLARGQARRERIMRDTNFG